MNEQGIAWMIAGGVRAESGEGQRQRIHRLAIANSNASTGGTLHGLRQRIDAVVGSVRRTDSPTLTADCCPA